METCFYCSLKVSSHWMTTENRPACGQCIRDLPDCPHCLRVILPGDGLTDYHKDCYCYRCADARPHCCFCQEPLFEPHSGPRCSACAHKTFCRQCRRDCSGEHFLDDQGPRCLNCCTCLDCGEIGIDITDSKCPGCAGPAVMTLAEGLALYPAAYEFIRDICGLTIEHIPGLHLSLEVPEANYREYPEAVREGRFIAGLFCGQRIWVKSGQREPLCLLILVHELAHAWQAENCPPQSNLLSEGFACWLAYHCALHLNYPALAERIRSDKCPVYGGGVRLCLLWEEAVGAQRMVEALRLHHDFPEWLTRGWYRAAPASRSCQRPTRLQPSTGSRSMKLAVARQ